MVYSRTRIKVCGTTSQADAEAAVRAGVDALGFIFAEKSPRIIPVEKAAEIIGKLPSFISSVGVFVDSSFNEVKETVLKCGLTQVQLHGSETPEFCSELKTACRSLSICKAFRVGEGGPAGYDGAARG